MVAARPGDAGLGEGGNWHCKGWPGGNTARYRTGSLLGGEYGGGKSLDKLLVTMIRGFSMFRDSAVDIGGGERDACEGPADEAGEGDRRGVGIRTMGGFAMLNVFGDAV